MFQALITCRLNCFHRTTDRSNTGLT